MPGTKFNFLGYTFHNIKKAQGIIRVKGKWLQRKPNRVMGGTRDYPEEKIYIYPQREKLRNIKNKLRELIRKASN